MLLVSGGGERIAVAQRRHFLARFCAAATDKADGAMKARVALR